MNNTLTRQNKMLKFENRAWKEAEYPRLTSNEIQFKDETYSFEIGFHYGRKQWCLKTFKGKNGSKPMKFFSNVKSIKEYLEKEYECKAKIPREFLNPTQ